jgi:hypothetical protein
VKKLKSFDQYVTEAQREALELPLPSGDTVEVHFPTGRQQKAFRNALRAEDTDSCIAALFGDEQAQQLITLFDDAPGDLLLTILKDMGEAWGVSTGELTG